MNAQGGLVRGHGLRLVVTPAAPEAQADEVLVLNRSGRRKPEQAGRLTRYLVKRLERLGHRVVLEPAA